MSRSTFNPVISPARVDLRVDLGHPFLNRTVDGFLKVGAVAAAKVAAEETYKVVAKGNISQQNLEHSLKKMCKEGAYWGTVAGVYVGMEYGVEKVRGSRDWKNALIGGALTGAVVSVASNSDREKIVMHAITGGAVATAVEFLTHHHHHHS